MSLSEFADLLSPYFPHIDKTQLQCTKISSPWNFHRVQLPFENWHTLYENSLVLVSGPFYVSTDGLLFIVRDGSIPERELTNDEKEMFHVAEFENQLFST